MTVELSKLNIHITYDPVKPLLGTHPTKMWADVHQIPVQESLLFIIAKKQKQPKCPSRVDWINCSIFTQWNITDQ